MRFQVILDVKIADREAQMLVDTGGVVLDTQEKALLALTMLAVANVRPPLREFLLAPEAEMPELGVPILLTTSDSPTQMLITINPGDTPCPTTKPVPVPSERNHSRRGGKRRRRG